MEKKTILHTIETWGTGGAETVLIDLASRLDKQKFDSIVLLPRDGWMSERLRAMGVDTLTQDPKNSRPLEQMADIVRSRNVDIIHSHLPDQNFYATIVGKWTGTKTIATYHGALDARMRGRLKFWFVRHWATACVAVSGYLEASMDKAGVNRAKLHRIDNGINFNHYTSTPRTSQLRSELKLSPESKLVGMVSNIRQYKGYEHFVEAAARVLAKFPDTRFVAIGELEEEQAVLEVRRKIEELKLQDRFFLLGFRENVPALLQELSIFVLASLSEGFSLATIEAMAAGKPVVVTRSGGPEEIVNDGETGVLVPAADPESLEGAICRLLQDPSEAEILGRNAKLEVERRYAMEKMVAQYEALYVNCMGRN